MESRGDMITTKPPAAASVRNRMSAIRLVVLRVGMVVLVTMVIVGCSSPVDRGAFDDWRRTDRQLYGGRHTDLPRLDQRESSVGESSSLPAHAELNDYIRFAVEHHPGLKAAFYRWRASLERIPQARSLPDPQVSFAVVLDEVDRSTQYMGERYAISQMFPWFGKLELRGDVALAEARAEAQRFEAERLKLVERVTQAYAEYAYLQRAAEIARENRALLTRLEAVAMAQFRAGTTSQADVNRAQVELGRLDDQVRSLQDMLGSAAADLNYAIGRPAHAVLPAPPGQPSSARVIELPARSDEQWLALARDHNPDLLTIHHDATGRQHAIDLARREYWPDVMFELEYARDGSARMAMMDGGGADMLMGKVALNLPIWRDKLDAGVREAHAQFRASLHQLEDQQITVESDLKRALFAYRDAQRKLQLYRGTLLPKSRQALATTEAGYRAGDATFSDLLDAQRVQLEFELAYERAAADRMLAIARVWRNVGTTETMEQLPVAPGPPATMPSTQLSNEGTTP